MTHQFEFPKLMSVMMWDFIHKECKEALKTGGEESQEMHKNLKLLPDTEGFVHCSALKTDEETQEAEDNANFNVLCECECLDMPNAVFDPKFVTESHWDRRPITSPFLAFCCLMHGLAHD